MNRFLHSAFLAFALVFAASAGDWVVYPGGPGPGQGKHIVLIGGDEEYRSEEALPQLGKILSTRLGFKCTVLFAVNPATGEIDPNNKSSVPGIEAVDSADLCILLLRFREWPDEQMKHFVDYYLAGKPFVALRTSTHAFNYDTKKDSIYRKYSYNSREWPGGFGKQVLGETWVAHHGAHKKEATRGIFEAGARENPIMRGVEEVFGDTDVYTAHPPADAQILLRGQVLVGMKPTDPPVEGKKNDPMQAVAWTREYKNEAGKTNRIFTTTMGSSTDLQDEGLRRMIVNASFWALGMENKIPAKAPVDLVGEYHPTMYGFNGFTKGIKPSAHELSR